MQSWSLLSSLRSALSPEKAATLIRSSSLVILAGGLGQRFGSQSPKGCIPLSPARGASLFQLLAERVAAIDMCIGSRLPVALLLHRGALAAVEALWREHDWFGLQPEQVQWVIQPELVIRDPAGRPIELSDGTSPTMPSGNGALWHSLERAHVLSGWWSRGVQFVHVLPIDNALAWPVAPRACAALQRHKLAVALQGVARVDPEESLGVFDLEGCCIREYLDLPARYRGAEGLRRYPWGFTGGSIWTAPAIQHALAQQLPVHWVPKQWAHNGSVYPILKGEQFLFDSLRGYPAVGVDLVERADRFCPLKEADGARGPEAVRKALTRLAQKRLHELGAPVDQVAATTECHPELWLTEGGVWKTDPRGWTEATSSPLDQLTCSKRRCALL